MWGNGQGLVRRSRVSGLVAAAIAATGLMAVQAPAAQAQKQCESLDNVAITAAMLGLKDDQSAPQSGVADIGQWYGLAEGELKVRFKNVQTRNGGLFVLGNTAGTVVSPSFEFTKPGNVIAKHQQTLGAGARDGILSIDGVRFTRTAPKLVAGVFQESADKTRPFVKNLTKTVQTASSQFVWKSNWPSKGVAIWSDGPGHSRYYLEFQPVECTTITPPSAPGPDRLNSCADLGKQSLKPSDLGLAADSLKKSGTADISSLWGTPKGTVKVTYRNVSSLNNKFMIRKEQKGSSAMPSFEFSVQGEITAAHGGDMAGDSKDGLRSNDGVQWKYIGAALRLPLRYGGSLVEPYVANTSSLGLSPRLNDLIWISKGRTDNVGFFATGEGNSRISLDFNPQVCSQDAGSCKVLKAHRLTPAELGLSDDVANGVGKVAKIGGIWGVPNDAITIGFQNVQTMNGKLFIRSNVKHTKLMPQFHLNTVSKIEISHGGDLGGLSRDGVHTLDGTAYEPFGDDVSPPLSRGENEFRPYVNNRDIKGYSTDKRWSWRSKLRTQSVEVWSTGPGDSAYTITVEPLYCSDTVTPPPVPTPPPVEEQPIYYPGPGLLPML